MDSRKIQAHYIARQANGAPNQENRHAGSDSTLNASIIGFVLNYLLNWGHIYLEHSSSRSFLMGLIMETIMKFIKVCIAMTRCQLIGWAALICLLLLLHNL
jgi:hypothetical protein